MVNGSKTTQKRKSAQDRESGFVEVREVTGWTRDLERGRVAERLGKGPALAYDLKRAELTYDLRLSDTPTHEPPRFSAKSEQVTPIELELIVPALNEENRIGSTLEALAQQLAALGRRTRLRVIDNGSTDRTADLVDNISSKWPSVDMSVEGCSRRGKGWAVSRGMLTSVARYVGFCDADLATPASAIIDAVTHLDDGWPVVIGSRHMDGAQRVVEQRLVRRLGSRGFRLMIKTLPMDLGLADTQCGFKFFHRRAALDIFSRTELGGFAFDVEVLSWARHLGYSILEFPVEWADQVGSSLRPVKHGFEVTRDLMKLRRSFDAVT